MRYLWFLVFLLAAILWSVQINRPVDLPAWHEFDYSSIARNFFREGNNILYPRIDWRGTGPGFTEMEFPIIPWVMAQLYRVFGMHEIIGRLLSYVFMLLALFVFSRIALRVLPESAAFVAVLFFVVSHEVVQVATAIQPEALMLLLYLMAVYFFFDWYDRQKWTSYTLAAVSFCGAMLVKSPAAHLGLFFLFWALHKDGLTAFRRPSLYLFAVLSLAPVIWWYAHAAGLWHQFHNSMGVSNEDHWIGLDLLRRPKVILNLFSIDLFLVCGIGGALVTLAALRRDKLTKPATDLALRWCLCISIYLILIIRTSGAYWAAYYHVVAVPPLALLFGAGTWPLQKQGARIWRQIIGWSGASAGCLVAALIIIGRRDLTHMPGVFQDLLAAQGSLSALMVLVVLSIVVTVLCTCLGHGHGLAATKACPKSTTVSVIAVGCFTYFFVSGQLLMGSWKVFASRTAQFSCSQRFRGKVAPGSLIVATGGNCVDAGGHRVANNAPEMFYWLDRKGFSTCRGRESISQLQEFAKRGARYFIVDKESASLQPSLQIELLKAFRVADECNVAWLFVLPPAN